MSKAKKNNALSVDYNESLFYIVLGIAGVVWGVFYGVYADKFGDIINHTTIAKYIMGNEYDLRNPYPHVLAYPLYHITQKIIAIVTGISYEMSAAILLSICNIVSVLLYRKLIMQVAAISCSSYLVDFISVSGVIFMPARSWLTDYTYYQTHSGANPLHNPTILFVRPFAILCVMLFLSIIEIYDEKGSVDLKQALLFSIVSLLSVFAKPSFALVFFPAMGAMCLVLMLQKRELKLGITMLLAIMPSLIAMIWQIVFTRSHSEATDFYFAVGGYTGYGFLKVIKITIGLIPCALILIHKSKNKAYALVWVGFLFGWLQMFGMSNGPSGDFSWGFALSMQFLTIISLAVSFISEREMVRKWQVVLGSTLFLYQFLIGLLFLRCAMITGEIWL